VAALLSEGVGFVLGLMVCRRYTAGGFNVPRARLFDRAKLMRLLAVNSDIMIRTAALIGAFLFFTAKGARAGDVTLAANSVLNNFLLVSAFFLDGLANAAQQLCGRTFGARDPKGFAASTRLVLAWGLGFALVVAVLFALFGPNLIDMMTASEDVRRAARDFLSFVVLAPVPGVFAFGFDGIYVGATWAREMRNLMLLSLAIFFGVWLALQSFGNTGLWCALIAFYVARGGLQGVRYPALYRMTFAKS
jgi:MATE family multidrug resistance protein